MSKKKKSILEKEQNWTNTEKVKSVIYGTKLRNPSYSKQGMDR